MIKWPPSLYAKEKKKKNMIATRWFQNDLVAIKSLREGKKNLMATKWSPNNLVAIRSPRGKKKDLIVAQFQSGEKKTS